MTDGTPWILYVKTRCPWCVEAVTYLRDGGYEFEQVDVLREPAEFAVMKKLSGQSYTPTLAVREGLLLADFDTDELEDFLRENDLLKEED